MTVEVDELGAGKRAAASLNDYMHEFAANAPKAMTIACRCLMHPLIAFSSASCAHAPADSLWH